MDGAVRVCESFSGSQQDRYDHGVHRWSTMLHISARINAPGAEAHFGWKEPLHVAGVSLTSSQPQITVDAREDQMGC